MTTIRTTDQPQQGGFDPSRALGAQAQRLLRELGTTADEVAETLRRHDVRGYHRNLDHCPVARYLAMMTNYFAKVGSGSATFYLSSSVLGVWLPKPVRDFIEAFDRLPSDGRSAYQDLLAPGTPPADVVVTTP